jgi:drug/metabolite transporter (DMT)-like permease
MKYNWKSSRKLAVVALLLVTAIWGWSFVATKDAIGKMPVLDFLAIKFLIAAFALFVIRPMTIFRINRRYLWHGVILGFVLVAIYITQTFGLLKVSASVSGFITGMGAVFTPLFLWVFLRRQIHPNIWIAVGLAVIGLALLSLRGWAFGIGELLTLVCAIFCAFQIIGLGEWSRLHNPYELNLVQISVAAIMCLLAAAPDGITLPPDFTTWSAVVILALPATAFAFFIQTWSQTLISPVYAALILTMEPVFAGFFGVFLGGDHLTIKMVIGAICILAAMLIAELVKPPEEKNT